MKQTKKRKMPANDNLFSPGFAYIYRICLSLNETFFINRKEMSQSETQKVKCIFVIMGNDHFSH